MVARGTSLKDHGACGVAKSTVSEIRSGKRVPAERHWEVLKALKDQVETHRLLGTPR
jgi:hypothetical protein